MTDREELYAEWLPIIGRSLAYLCLDKTSSASATIADKAAFLENLGINRKDIAGMLGTTPASVAELLRLRKKKGKSKGGKKK